MVAIDNPAMDQQIASITRDSTTGLTAPVRLFDLRLLNQQATSSRGGNRKRHERNGLGQVANVKVTLSN